MCVYSSRRCGTIRLITPLSSYAFPFHSPFQTIGLPSFQSEMTSVPNMYCLIFSGLTSASQTSDAGAWMVVDALAVKFFSMTDGGSLPVPDHGQIVRRQVGRGVGDPAAAGEVVGVAAAAHPVA